MKRSGPPKRRTPLRARGKPRHRVSGQPDEPYRKYVRGLPCLVAQKLGHRRKCIARVQPHHVKTRGSGGSDQQLVPLCAGHHDEIHFMGRHSWAALHGLDLPAAAARLWAAYSTEER